MHLIHVAVVTALVLGAPSKPTNPADFPLTGTVKCSFSRSGVRMGVLLNGQMLEMYTSFAQVPMAPGDYKMRLSRNKQQKPYEVDAEYEMLLPDGSTRLLDVTGVGDGICGMVASS